LSPKESLHLLDTGYSETLLSSSLGKPEEVVTIYARDAYTSREGWLLLAAGIWY